MKRSERKFDENRTVITLAYTNAKSGLELQGLFDRLLRHLPKRGQFKDARPIRESTMPRM